MMSKLNLFRNKDVVISCYVVYFMYIVHFKNVYIVGISILFVTVCMWSILLLVYCTVVIVTE